MDAVEVWNGPWTSDDEASVSTWDGMLVSDARTWRWLPGSATRTRTDRAK